MEGHNFWTKTKTYPAHKGLSSWPGPGLLDMSKFDFLSNLARFGSGNHFFQWFEFRFRMILHGFASRNPKSILQHVKSKLHKEFGPCVKICFQVFCSRWQSSPPPGTGGNLGSIPQSPAAANSSRAMRSSKVRCRHGLPQRALEDLASPSWISGPGRARARFCCLLVLIAAYWCHRMTKIGLHRWLYNIFGWFGQPWAAMALVIPVSKLIILR